MLGARPCSFPMEQQHKLSTDFGPSLLDPALYRRLVGRFLYLTITQPDICYSVNILNQFMHDPLAAHLDVAMRVLRYLKFTLGQGLLLTSTSSLQVRAYCDSNWASCPMTRRFTTEYFTLLGTLLFLGNLRNKPLFLTLQLRPNIELCLLLLVS